MPQFKLSSEIGFTLIEVLMGAAIMAIVSAALIGAFMGQASLNLTSRNLTAAMTDATRVMEEIRKQNTGAACAGGVPSAKPPLKSPTSSYKNWDEWLTLLGKSMTLNSGTTFETVAVTCQDDTAVVCVPQTQVVCTGGKTTVTCPAIGQAAVSCGDGGPLIASTAPYCGSLAGPSTRAQIGTDEWKSVNAATVYDPIRVTVATGWVQNSRIIGSSDFYYQGETTAPGGFKSPPVTTPAHLAVQESGNDGVVTSQAMLSSVVTCR